MPVRWDDELKPCRKCGIPTGWRTKRGSPVHDECADPVLIFRVRSVEAELDGLYLLADALGPLTAVPPGDLPPRRDRLPFQQGPCGWCGRPGLLYTVDRYFHCPQHLWPPYRWPTTNP